MPEDFCTRFCEALKIATDSLSEKLDCENIAEKVAQKIDCENIADRVAQKLKGDSELSETEAFNVSECFQETDDERLYCVPCFKHTSSPLLPSHLKNGLKGNFGFFNKPDDLNYKKNKERKKQMLDHTRMDVHGWCVNQEKQTLKKMPKMRKIGVVQSSL